MRDRSARGKGSAFEQRVHAIGTAPVNAIVGAFAVTWLGYFGLIALLPIRYGSVELADAFCVLTLYLVATIASALGLRAAERPGSRPGRHYARLLRPLDDHELNRIVVVGLLLSGVGVVLIAYVRLFVQGIDYSQGLAVARQLWRVEGEQRGGVSSVLSIPGYGLGFFFYASTFLGHLHWEHLSRRVRACLILGSLALIGIHSVLTGGRSALLMLLISVLATAAIRRAQGRKAFPGRFWRTAIVVVSGLFGAVSYFLYVFSERASASGIDSDAYAQSMVNFMGASPSEGFLAIASWPEPFAAVAHFSVIAGAYVTHSVGTLASVMEYSSQPGATMFVGLRELMVRLELLNSQDTNWVLSGAFLSLPGDLWYDYGITGVLVGAAVTGAALAVICRLISRGSGGGISVAFSAAVLVTAVMSPLTFAPDILGFPFMVLGYIGLAAYSYFVFGPRNWWNVGRHCKVSNVPLVQGLASGG